MVALDTRDDSLQNPKNKSNVAAQYVFYPATQSIENPFIHFTDCSLAFDAFAPSLAYKASVNRSVTRVAAPHGFHK